MRIQLNVRRMQIPHIYDLYCRLVFGISIHLSNGLRHLKFLRCWKGIGLLRLNYLCLRHCGALDIFTIGNPSTRPFLLFDYRLHSAAVRKIIALITLPHICRISWLLKVIIFERQMWGGPKWENIRMFYSNNKCEEG